MDHHVEVLEQRVEPAPVGRRLRQVGIERVVVHHHQQEEEHLDGGDDGHNVRNQLAMTFAIRVDRSAPKEREQKYPEHDRAVEAAPVRGDLVEERQRGVGIVVDVLD
jgi:hypothetical protein